MNRLIGVTMVVLVAAMGVVAGCDREKNTSTGGTSTPAPAATAQLPEGVLLKEAPGGAKGIAEIKKSAKPGDEVVLVGKVGGRVDPISKDRALLTVMDTSVTSCDKMPGDNCKTPWDYCCEDRDSLVANSATVQVVDAEGKPIKGGLEGVGGIKPLSEVVVKGKVQQADGKVLVVNATGVFVR